MLLAALVERLANEKGLQAKRFMHRNLDHIYVAKDNRSRPVLKVLLDDNLIVEHFRDHCVNDIIAGKGNFSSKIIIRDNLDKQKQMLSELFSEIV